MLVKELFARAQKENFPKEKTPPSVQPGGLEPGMHWIEDRLRHFRGMTPPVVVRPSRRDFAKFRETAHATVKRRRIEASGSSSRS